MILEDIESKVTPDSKNFANLLSKLTLDDIKALPFGKIMKLTSLASDVSKLCSEKESQNQLIDVEDIRPILAKHLGEGVNNIDLVNFDVSQLYELLSLLGVSSSFINGLVDKITNQLEE